MFKFVFMLSYRLMEVIIEPLQTAFLAKNSRVILLVLCRDLFNAN